MNPSRDDLMALLAHKEDNFVERKSEGVKPGDIRKTVVAFANSVPEGRYAVLFIGVGDDGRILGCANTDEKQRAVRQACEGDCYPPIAMRSEVLSTPQGDVVAVVIAASTNKPHFTGQAYVRRGSQSMAASEEVFRELVYSQNSAAAALTKLKNTVVSFVSIQHKIGQVRRINDYGYREGGECTVLDVDPHRVRLQLVGGDSRYFSEPLDHIKIMHDENKHRSMLVFSGY